MLWFIILPGNFHGNLKSFNQEHKALLRCASWIGFNNALKAILLFQLFSAKWTHT